MTIISLTYIGGFFLIPQKNPLRCSMDYGQKTGTLDTLIHPELTSEVLNFDLSTLKAVRDNFQSSVADSAEFWKIRSIIHFASAPQFCSVTFIPSDFTSKQTWFVQKNKTEPPYHGFLAPFLTKELQVQLGSNKELGGYDIIKCEQDISDSLANIEPTVYSHTHTLLNYFLNDLLTAAVSFTYLDYRGNLTTRTWSKASL